VQLSVDKDGQQYFAALEIKNVTVEDAGKYKVTAKNELGESNATITLNFDSKYLAINIAPLKINNHKKV
jgi:Immunoglobulin I-set domain